MPLESQQKKSLTDHKMKACNVDHYQESDKDNKDVSYYNVNQIKNSHLLIIYIFKSKNPKNSKKLKLTAKENLEMNPNKRPTKQYMKRNKAKKIAL